MNTTRRQLWLRFVLMVQLILAGSLELAAQRVTLAWDTSVSSNIVSYSVYYGVVSGAYGTKVDVGNVTSATLPGLTPGTTYFFAVTCVDSNTLESTYSTEVSYVVGTNLPSVVGLSAIGNTGRDITTAQLPFFLTSALTNPDFALAAVSSNPLLLPPSGLVLGGTGTNRWMTITPGLGQVGSAIVTLKISDGYSTNSASMNFVVTPPNQAPLVDAGTNATLRTNVTFLLRGRVSDDGLPLTPGRTTARWSKISGPGTVTFGNTNFAVTTARLSALGIYRLRLTGSDGELTSFMEVILRAQASTDTNPPAITQLSVADVTDHTITLTWTTDELADGQAIYAPAGGIALGTLLDPTPKLSHTVVVTNLQSGVTYSLAAKSKDSAGNKTVSAPVVVSTLQGSQVYVSAPADQSAPGVLPNSSGLWGSGNQEWASFSAYVPVAGQYVVWMWMNSAPAPNRTFSVTVDNGVADVCDSPETGWGSGPQWIAINGRNGLAPRTLTPRVFALSAATHAVQIVGTGSQTSIGKILLTDDLSFNPALDPTTCCNGAADSTVSAYAIYIRQGWSLFGCPLTAPATEIQSLLPNPPAGTEFHKFEASTGTFAPNAFDGSSWDLPGMALTPGQGGLIHNPGADFRWVVAGTLAATPAPLGSLLHTGSNLVCLPTPKAGLLSTVLNGFTFKAGDNAQRVNALTGDYTTYHYDGRRWDVVPVVNLGEAFYLNLVAR